MLHVCNLIVLLTVLFFASFYLGHWKESVTIVLHNTIENIKIHIANNKNKKTDIKNNDYLLCMHAVFMGMPTASSKGGVPLTGMHPLTTMARHTGVEAACIGAQSGSLPDSSNAWHCIHLRTDFNLLDVSAGARGAAVIKRQLEFIHI